jgi:hypothetical protein
MNFNAHVSKKDKELAIILGESSYDKNCNYMSKDNGMAQSSVATGQKTETMERSEEE